MTQNKTTAPGKRAARQIMGELWTPMSLDDIRTFPANTTASDPDGMTARMRKIPLDLLVRVYNLIMWCGSAPSFLLESVTTLISIKSKAREPTYFWPITISSVWIRTLHKILAGRLVRKIELDQRQRAFRQTDRCSDNIFLLDLMLRMHHSRKKPLYIALLDIAKAFDSLTHK